MLERRSLLRGLVTLPLLGGGVTLIGRPAAAVPLVQAAALPTLDDPRQRAAYGWAAFSGAMDDLTAGTGGWRIIGAGNVRPWGHYEGCNFVRLAEVRFEVDDDPRLRRPLVIERLREIALDPAEEARLRERELRGEVRI